jgi:C4-dicarboxylate-binding protein DctP
MKKSTIIIAVLAVGMFAYMLYTIFSFETVNNTKIQKKQHDQTIHLKFGHNTPVDSALHEAALRFANKIKEKTEGKVIVDIFPAQKLGNDHKMVEMARQGELDILLTPTAKMSVAVPSIQYADLPFFFPTREDLYEMLDGEPGDMILSDMKPIGLIGITFWENGFKHITANSPILSPYDLRGKKIRVMKSRIIMEQFKSFGAKPIPIDFHVTKKALKNKVVDGQENPLIAIVSMGFHEVQSDLTLSEHAFLGYVFSLSEKSMLKLPKNFRNLLIQTAKEITPWEREETQRREKKLLDVIKNAGVKIHTLTQEQHNKFAQLVKHIPAQFEDVIGVDVISKTQELLYEKYGSLLDDKEAVLIGINCNTSVGGAFSCLEIKRGVTLAVSEINAEGGVLGKPLQIILKDHKMSPSKGTVNIQQFNENPNLVAIIGGKHSAVISENLSTIESLKIPYLIPWAATEKIVNNNFEDNYVFRISANDALASKFITEYTMKNYKKPVIIAENSIWGREYRNSMRKYMRDIGYSFSKEILFNRGQKNFEKDIKDVIDSGADSIVLIADSLEATQLIHELSKQKSKLSVISHWGITGGNFFEENKQILSHMDLKVFQTFSFSGASNNKIAKKLFKHYKKKYKTDSVKVDHAVAQAYDLTKILALAIEKAGTLQREKIKEALENLKNYQGVLKRYNPPFTSKLHDALVEEDFYMAKFNSSGALVPIGKR